MSRDVDSWGLDPLYSSYRKICAGVLGAITVKEESIIAGPGAEGDASLPPPPLLLKMYLVGRPVRRVELAGVVVSRALQTKRNGAGSKLVFTVDDMTGVADCIQFFDGDDAAAGGGGGGDGSDGFDSDEDDGEHAAQQRARGAHYLSSNAKRESSSDPGSGAPSVPRLVAHRGGGGGGGGVLALGSAACVKGELFRFMGKLIVRVHSVEVLPRAEATREIYHTLTAIKLYRVYSSTGLACRCFHRPSHWQSSEVLRCACGRGELETRARDDVRGDASLLDASLLGSVAPLVLDHLLDMDGVIRDCSPSPATTTTTAPRGRAPVVFSFSARATISALKERVRDEILLLGGARSTAEGGDPEGYLVAAIDALEREGCVVRGRYELQSESNNSSDGAAPRVSSRFYLTDSTPPSDTYSLLTVTGFFAPALDMLGARICTESTPEGELISQLLAEYPEIPGEKWGRLLQITRIMK